MADSGSADMGSIPVGGTAKRVEALLLPVFFIPSFSLCLFCSFVSWRFTPLLRYSTSLSRSVTRSDSTMRTVSIIHMRKCSSVAALLLLLSVLLCRGRSRSDGRNHHCRFCWYGLCEKWSLLLYNPDQNRNHPLMTNLVSWSVSLSSTQQ